jgi:hypothetical protein
MAQRRYGPVSKESLTEIRSYGCGSCFAGFTTLIIIDEDGNEQDEATPCRNCQRPRPRRAPNGSTGPASQGPTWEIPTWVGISYLMCMHTYIHQSAWKYNSRKFAVTSRDDLRLTGAIRRSCLHRPPVLGALWLRSLRGIVTSRCDLLPPAREEKSDRPVLRWRRASR